MIKRILLVSLVLCSNSINPAAQGDLEKVLSFEAQHEGDVLGGWGGGPPGTLFADDIVVHHGKWSARIERGPDSAGGFSSLTMSIPIDFAGSTLELSGFLRTEQVSDWTGLWLREDGDAGSLAFDNMQKQQVRGTTPWTEYRIRLPLAEEAHTVVLGALLAGEGKVWIDDLRVLVDGKPVSEAPKVKRPETVLDTDTEFDDGSGISISSLSEVQVSNLRTLGLVWGFLKYHHPAVTGGRLHWDYELFRILPAVLEAADRRSANEAILSWARSLGEPPGCDPCAMEPEDVHFSSALDWIRDRENLGDELALLLEEVHVNRDAGGKQFYVSLAPNVGNPVFSREKGYQQFEHPDAGYRILSLFRLWNIVRYWFPYRDLIEGEWDPVLAEFLPRLVAATDPDRYRLEMLALIARVKDGHANLWGSLDVRPPRGDCLLPVRFRFIEGKAVVTGHTTGGKVTENGLAVGDVVLGLDGKAVPALIESWAPYYAASNEEVRLRDIARSMARGPCGTCKVEGSRGSERFELEVERVPEKDLDLAAGWTHDLPGETFRLLSPEVAYLKLSSAKMEDASFYIERSEGAAGLIIDIRNYPSEFMVFALGQYLVGEETPFARFTTGDLANPGTFVWRGEPLSLTPGKTHYKGQVVILVDELSMSQAEYTAMAFRVAPGAIVVGSTTAGADGNVSAIPLPGGLRSMISGIGVFYPDRTPTQQVGILPDVEVRPTIEGIREGRDEVLEYAVRLVLGEDAPEDRVRKIASGDSD